ncbi:hybrid sensor histidine kinase/response regulator (plasmid) [Alcanivorax sp. N3-2A]|nr:hybrid sensor histidine kinase/response regulator [Alcanivorax sp. N3-2A]ASK36856.1 hybrid sensor histidine kinase/response regulator [Alcanivorax sp. N3-2A]|tara:strand:- start:40530 stop:43283 length:2754 start_codon:yes stop_codon:yes gene_type:complete
MGTGDRSPCQQRRRPAAFWWPLIVLTTLLASASHASPPPPFVIGSLPQDARITIYSEYLPDPGGTLSVADIARGRFDGDFQPASRFVERLGLSDHPWWVRVSIQNEMAGQSLFALVLGTRHYHDSVFYRPGPSGYRPSAASEHFQHRTPVQLLDLPVGQPRVYYWRINAHGSLVYSLRLTTLPAAMSNDPAFSLYWLLLGMMLTLALYNALVAVMRSAPSHAYHAGFLIFLVALILVSSGTLADSDFWGPLVPPLKIATLMLALASVCGVGRTFVNSRRHAPYLDRFLQVLMIIGPLSLLVMPWLPITVAFMLAYGFALIAAAALVTLGVLAWHREVPLGTLYFLSSLLVGSPVVVSCLSMIGVLQNDLDLALCLLITVNLAGVVQAVGLRLQQQRDLRLLMERRRSQTVEETADTTRRETLSRMGHDVRTPLSGILGMAEILEDTPLTPNQKDCVGGIRNAGESLLKIINDVLEYSQLSTQGADINREALNANELLMDAVELFRERAEEKQIELITHVHTNLPERMEGDPGRLRQVLTNLIGALIRRAQPGELVIDISLDPTGRAGQVRFELGGSALRAGTIVELRESSARQDSSGLNLSIAEQLLEAMGGRSGFRDEHGSEVLYWFVVPLPALESPQPRIDTDISALQGRSMLVVDDSSTVTRVIRHLALSWGMRVTACHDPREALASLRTQANLNEPYDVVLLDHLMPGINGMQLATRIQEDPVITHPAILIMLTGVNNAPTATEARNVGIHRVLSKPVSAPRLKQVLAEELGLQRRHPEPGRQQAPDPGLRLLVVEDHKLSQKVIRGMLNKLGLDAELAANGREALQMASQNRYDLILMDCEMPEMDGFEATRRIRQHEREHGLAPVPIVALTAHILREHRERSLASGMNAHIPKPVEINVLREALVRFTRGD